MDQRRGYEQSQEQPSYSRDDIIEKLADAYGEIQKAEEKFRNSKGRDEYTINIRALDAAKKEYKKWEETPFTLTIDELKQDLERADRDLKHAQNQQDYESAMRRVDSIQRKLQSLESNDETN